MLNEILQKMILLGIVSFTFSINPPYPVNRMNDEINKIIMNGGVHVKANSNQTTDYGNHFHGEILVNAPIRKVYETIKDFQNYPKFMPHINQVDTITINGKLNFRYFLDLPLGIKYKYQISDESFFSKEISWLTWQLENWDENSIEETWGQWIISPHNYSDSTLIQYQVYTKIGQIPYGFNWIVRLLTEKSLPDVLLNTKKWIEYNEKN